mmetsp:Transcript_77240/g.250190  ORF Transcript_77240/g.250190 Transcript_77240/m.250190 type:complete len:816 (+) Transcript_77240:201-2648(+)
MACDVPPNVSVRTSPRKGGVTFQETLSSESVLEVEESNDMYQPPSRTTSRRQIVQRAAPAPKGLQAAPSTMSPTSSSRESRRASRSLERSANLVGPFASALEGLAALHLDEVADLRRENVRLTGAYTRLEARFLQRWGPSTKVLEPDENDREDDETSEESGFMPSQFATCGPEDRWEMVVTKLIQGGGQDATVGRSISEDSLDPLPHWQMKHRQDTAGFLEVLRGQRTTDLNEGTGTGRACPQILAIDPTTKRYVVWGLSGMLLLMWDVITIPLSLFELGGFSKVLQVTNPFIVVYWSTDLVVQFFAWIPAKDFRTAVWEVRVSKISARYLKTWFLPDLCIISIDYVFMLSDAGGGSNAQGALRLSKVARFLRIIRILRLRKLKDILEVLVRRQNSEHVVVGIQLAKSVALLLLMSHYVACGWYALALYNDQDSINWIAKNELDGTDTGYVYTISLHWVMTQFSPATNNIVPTNFRERAFALAVVVYALIVFSSFVSGLTNAVNQLRRINLERTLEESLIQQFLKSKSISQSLSSDIKSFFRNSYEARRTRVREKDIPFFAEIPKALLVALHVEVYLPRLQTSALWIFHSIDEGLLAKVAHHSMSEHAVLPGQDVFEKRSQAKGVYCSLSGRLTYDMMYDKFSRVAGVSVSTGSLNGALRDEYSATDILPGEWMAEMALWVVWEHQGQLIAKDMCELTTLDCEAVGRVSETCSKGAIDLVRRFVVMLLALKRVNEPTESPLSDCPLEAELLLNAASRAWKFWQMSGGGSNNEYKPCWVADPVTNLLSRRVPPRADHGRGLLKSLSDMSSASANFL